MVLKNRLQKFRESGFVFSLDATVSVFLIASAMFMLVGLQNQNSLGAGQVSTLTEDTLFALDNSAYIIQTIDSNSLPQSAGIIRSKVLEYLPRGLDAKIWLRVYSADTQQCASAQTFSACFPDSNRAYATAGGEPFGQQVSGKKFFVRKQPPGDCNMSYLEFSSEEDALRHAISEAIGNSTGMGLADSLLSEAGANFSEAKFLEDANITFDVNVTPGDYIECDKNVLVRLSVTVPESIRKPIDVMLIIDRSGSMSWGGEASTTFGQAVELDQSKAYAYLSDASAGARSIDIANPLEPVLRDLYDPGTAIDIAVDRNWVFIADTYGTDEIYAVNKTNPIDLSYAGKISVQTSRGIYAYQNYVYLAGTASNTTGLVIFNASNPASMSLAGRVATTSPRDVFVDGNYAYLADGSAGLRIINVTNKASPSISGTYNTPGTAYKAFVRGNFAYVADGSNGLVVVNVANKSSPSLAGSYNTPGTAYAAFVDGNIAYVADRSSLIALNVNNPASITQIARYTTPYTYYGVQVLNGMAYLAAGSMGIITIDLSTGPRIDNAKASAKSFIDFNGWQTPPDQLGLASFNTSATLDRSLTSDRNSVKTGVDALVASGGTDIESGIRAANTELASARHNPSAMKFEVLLSDGQSTEGNSLAAATEAKANGIIIFTIAFGEDADVAELTSIANATDGNFYTALDANALNSVFRLIAQRVSEIANDSNLSVPLVSGAGIYDYNGQLADGNLIFNAGTITMETPFVTTYKVNFSCTNETLCMASAFTFPGPGTKFKYYDNNGNLHLADFNDSITLPFRSRDLNVEITSGDILANESVVLGVKVENSGKLDANSTTLRIRLDDANGEILATYPVPALCSRQTMGCESYSAEFPSIGLSTEGVIYATINEGNEIRDCPAKNIDAVNCYGGASLQVYAVEYAVWRP